MSSSWGGDETPKKKQRSADSLPSPSASLRKNQFFLSRQDTAVSESDLVDDLDDYKCPVCFDTLDLPVRLTDECNHAVCYCHVLDLYVNVNFSCVICRRPGKSLDAMEIDYKLMHQIQSKNANSSSDEFFDDRSCKSKCTLKEDFNKMFFSNVDF
jgi:hypothetical protein